MLNRRQFVWSFISSISAAGLVLHGRYLEGGPRQPDNRSAPYPPPPNRVGCLFNGYFLSVDPAAALASDPSERNRLYVLHAVLIDTGTGKIVATFPSLPHAARPGDTIAHPVEDYSNLDMEQPPAPAITMAELVQYWTARDVDTSLLTGVWWIDLDGAVATPGLIDDHFHVSSWSKKLPPEGSRFGFYADIGDPAYYTNVTTWSRFCVRKALWKIVADANTFLAEENKSKIYLHGYWYTMADETGEGGYPASFLFRQNVEETEPNPTFLINRIGREGSATADPPDAPCTSDPSTWPDVDYEVLPALLVHTSGQACWYNVALLAAFNEDQEHALEAFEAAPVSMVTPPAHEDGSWEISLVSGLELSGQTAPFRIDLVVPDDTGGATFHVPFYIESMDLLSGVLEGMPILAGIAEDILSGDLPTGIRVIPFARPIPTGISDAAWDAATAYSGETPESEYLAYGHWDPRAPYETNWYNGAERGLVEYVHDTSSGVWRPSGYAEHYVMRDRLSAYVLEPLTPVESMNHRRNLARWCHRHGITSVQDIMFYRRQSALGEFAACEGLSFNHHYSGGMEYYREWGIHPSENTGGFNLRVGLYYYVENAGGIPEVMGLAASDRSDVDRLMPPPDHPEYPGWVRWLGWKLQLDGGIGARTLFSNAPIVKPMIDDPYTVSLEDGSRIRFADHDFGLLTMTNVQDQVFTSRESAALYWLVRESDPDSPFHNSRIGRDWSFLRKGVAGWLDIEADTELLASDLSLLEHVELEDSDRLAEKLTTVLEQVSSGWERTLSAMVRIWYECSLRAEEGTPIPFQTVCHAAGDGGVDLYVRMIRQLRDDLENLPDRWEDLPSWWKDVLPEDADLSLVRRSFEGERFRVEHLLNVSASVFEDLHGENGLDVSTSPSARNVVFSVQPALLVLDGEPIKKFGFPYAQELWDIPDDHSGQMWLGVPAQPRWHHHIPCPVFRDRDIPFCLSSDPPAVRDPRPAITIIGATARTPVEIDPTHWVGQETGSEPERPVDYLVGAVYGPLGLTPSTPENPMSLSITESLCAMTFWAAYVVGLEKEIGALAVPGSLGEEESWFADIVVWAFNPLAITGPDGMRLQDLATLPEGNDPEDAVRMCNAFIKKFRPSMTFVGGIPVYGTDNRKSRQQIDV